MIGAQFIALTFAESKLMNYSQNDERSMSKISNLYVLYFMTFSKPDRALYEA